MFSQFTQLAIVLILAVVYIRSPVLAQNDTVTNSSNTSNVDANSTANGTLGNGAGCILPMEHTVILLTIGGAATLLSSMVIH